MDLRRFPCLALARDALRAGGILPNVLNAANEVAVEAFLAERLAFPRIAEVIERTLAAAGAARLPGDESLDAVLEVDGWARAAARGQLGAKAVAHA